MSIRPQSWSQGPARRDPSVTVGAIAGDAGRGQRRVRALVLAAEPTTSEGVLSRLKGHPAIEVLGVVHHADQAVVECARRGIDVVVAVSEAPAGSARLLRRAASIRATCPATRVVVALGGPQRVLETLLARPDGLLAAAAPSHEVRAVVGTAAAGHLVIGRSLREEFFRVCVPASEVTETPTDDLTPREVQVISAVARGLTSREIADERSLAVNTVDKALSTIYRKLGARNRVEACLIAARRGLLR